MTSNKDEYKYGSSDGTTNLPKGMQEKKDFVPYCIEVGTDPMFGHIYRMHCGKFSWHAQTYTKFFDVSFRITENGTSKVYSVIRHLTNKDGIFQPWSQVEDTKEYAFAVSIVAAYIHDKKIKTNPV